LCTLRIVSQPDCYALVVQDVKPVMLRASRETELVLGMSLGYFALDVCLMTVHYPTVGAVQRFSFVNSEPTTGWAGSAVLALPRHHFP
jgi:hypothetical protein